MTKWPEALHKMNLASVKKILLQLNEELWSKAEWCGLDEMRTDWIWESLDLLMSLKNTK